MNLNIEKIKKILRNDKVYNDFELEFIAARKRAKKLTNQYNKTSDEDLELREKLLIELFGKKGKNTIIEPNFRCEFGFNIQIGNNFYANFDCIILDCDKVKIGNNVLFGPRVCLYGANHCIDSEERISGGCYSLPIIIGNNVWIGGGVNINPGVMIGSNSIIGSGSVVTKNIPKNVIAVGNPCKVLREITKKDKERNFYKLTKKQTNYE
ncbi:MAG: sugar O-acetyltransferase [Elusimicrobiota bacterium]|jgi:maltose O-acetyltransferase|nr:sugar O-acetyltransferase [Elusimicrobiota bacterium]